MLGKFSEKSVLLSLCIPTYSRPYELRRLLQSIAMQYCDDVQVLVGDDGDSRITKKILSEFTSMNITYIENMPRKGFSRNLLSASEHAIGEYVWWLGDDDELEKGALMHILEIIKKEKPSILWANVRSSASEKPYILRKDSGYLKTSNEAIEQIGPLITFISSIIFQKKYFLEIDKLEIAKFENSIFLNILIVFRVILARDRLYYVAQSCVIAHWTAPGDSWHNTFQTFGIDFLDIMRYFKKEFSTHAYRVVVGRMFSFCWKALLMERARTSISLYPIIIPMIKRYWSYSGIFIAVPLFLLPRFIIIVFYQIYRISSVSL